MNRATLEKLIVPKIESGMSLSEIQEETGIKYSELKAIREKHFPDQNRDRIIEMIREGKSCKQIAELVGTRWQAIANAYRKEFAEAKKKKKKQENPFKISREEICELIEDGLTCKEIGIRAGVAPQTIASQFRNELEARKAQSFFEPAKDVFIRYGYTEREKLWVQGKVKNWIASLSRTMERREW